MIKIFVWIFKKEFLFEVFNFSTLLITNFIKTLNIFKIFNFVKNKSNNL